MVTKNQLAPDEDRPDCHSSAACECWRWKALRDPLKDVAVVRNRLSQRGSQTGHLHDPDYGASPCAS